MAGKRKNGLLRKRLLLALAVCFVSGSATIFGCGEGRKISVESEMNVLLITIDTLRADHLGCYGYDKRVSKMIDALASQGVQFNNCMSQSPITPVSHASILTGQNPYRHGVRTLEGGEPHKLGADHFTLATLLKDASYQTAAFISSVPLVRERYGLDNGFDVYEQSFYEAIEFDQATQQPDSRRDRNPTQRRADLTTSLAIEWLHGIEEGPFFAWIHYFDVHETYLIPPMIPGVFMYSIEGPLTDIHPQMYDVELRFVDMMIEKLIGKLYEMGLGRNTLIVLTSDHGQGLGDHDYHYHGERLYQEQIHIPLLFVGGSIPSGVKSDRLVRSIDIVPSVLDVLGYPPKSIPAGIEGNSLRGLWEAEGAPPKDVSAAYSETLYPIEAHGKPPIFSIVDGDFKLISHGEANAENELFNLSSDPAELNNIISEHPEHGDRLMEMIANLQAGTTIDVKPTTGKRDKESEALLKSLGYLN